MAGAAEVPPDEDEEEVTSGPRTPVEPTEEPATPPLSVGTSPRPRTKKKGSGYRTPGSRIEAGLHLDLNLHLELAVAVAVVVAVAVAAASALALALALALTLTLILTTPTLLEALSQL